MCVPRKCRARLRVIFCSRETRSECLVCEDLRGPRQQLQMLFSIAVARYEYE